jgi:hypothetical protein
MFLVRCSETRPRFEVRLARYKLTHLGDAALLRTLASLVAQDRVTTAALLAHIAEVDARGLYLPRGYASMHAYCVEALYLSDDAAYKRIQAARAARRFPALFDAVADGRLHLSAVCLIAPHLTPDALDRLVALATHRRKIEIERALAEMFAVEGWAAPAAAPAAQGQATIAPQLPQSELAPGQVAFAPIAPAADAPTAAAPAPAPPGPRPHTLRIELTPALHDKLRRAQALLAHAVPTGDPAEILDRALDALITQVEGRKFGRTARPRRHGEATKPAAPRTVPARVRRAVATRDGDRCAFVGSDGHRCTSRRKLEFDHVQPLARGGPSTEEGMRLLCRAHNRFEAERIFGRDFMLRKQHECVQERGQLAPGQVPAAEPRVDRHSSRDELRE